MPKHNFVPDLSITECRYASMWRNFHVYVSNEDYDNDNNVADDNDTDDDENNNNF